MRRLIILGAGDLGREVMHTAADNHAEAAGSCFETIAFVDDDASKVGGQLEGRDVIGWSDLAARLDDHTFVICGVGSPAGRRAMLRRLADTGVRAPFAVVVHRSAVVMPNVELAPGTYVAANATVGTGCRLAAHVVVNQNVSVGHDCTLDEGTVVSPGCALSGRTRIGQYSFLGSNAVTYPGVTIGQDCKVSALAVVARSVKDGKSVIAKPNVMVM